MDTCGQLRPRGQSGRFLQLFISLSLLSAQRPAVILLPRMSTLKDKLAGKFIVIDGPDGAGKSTQIKLLAEHLMGQGVDLCLARDPGGTAIGEKIRHILLDNTHDAMSVQCELMLYMASRSQLVHEIIRPALAAGQCVLCDRFISATIAYQGAGGASLADIRAVGNVAVGGLWPNLTVILDLPSHVGLGRLGGKDRMEAREAAFHEKVRQMFLKQAADEPARFAVVDGSGAVDEVQSRLRATIESWRFK